MSVIFVVTNSSCQYELGSSCMGTKLPTDLVLGDDSDDSGGGNDNASRNDDMFFHCLGSNKF